MPTSQPARARATAVALPMPESEPVTIAIRAMGPALPRPDRIRRSLHRPGGPDHRLAVAPTRRPGGALDGARDAEGGPHPAVAVPHRRAHGGHPRLALGHALHPAAPVGSSREGAPG